MRSRQGYGIGTSLRPGRFISRQPRCMINRSPSQAAQHVMVPRRDVEELSAFNAVTARVRESRLVEAQRGFSERPAPSWRLRASRPSPIAALYVAPAGTYSEGRS